MNQVTKIAWLAGFLEGEGHFNRNHTRIVFGTTDKDTAEKAASILGYSVLSIRKSNRIDKPHWKTCYYVTVSVARSIQWMMTLYTLMSTRRKEQIRAAIEVWKGHTTRRPRGAPAICHPDKPHLCHGYCNACYQRLRYRKRKGYIDAIPACITI